MAKKKENLWGKLTRWQKGGLVGVVVGILVQLIVVFVDLSSVGYYHVVFIHIIPAIMFNIDLGEFSILIVVWYSTLGIFLGMLYHFMEKKFGKGCNLGFFVILAILLVFLYFTGLLIVGQAYNFG